MTRLRAVAADPWTMSVAILAVSAAMGLLAGFDHYLVKPIQTTAFNDLLEELRRPADFEDAAKHVSIEESTKETPVGPDVEPYVDAIRKCVDAGFDHVGLHQIGPDQDGFFAFWEKELRPALRGVMATAR